ncbi:hypothetical protein AU476_06340 [Cupriavidus sp. UYMSc13B]|nr:hypothetical protein AU476_06340 [Cupriavidus sp. UYMSc13B]
MRLLPTTVYMEVAEKLRALRDEFEGATAQFLADYPRLKDEARVALNGLFEEADYPTEAELRRKFGVRFSVLPFPDASQFGIDLPPDVLRGIRNEMDAKVMSAVKTANNDLVGRLYEAVQHFANRLYGEGNVRLDVADKVRELSTLLPKLNFSDDAVLADILARTQNQLACYTGAQLKDDPLLRLNVAERAMEIEAQMAAFMGGPPLALTRDSDIPMLQLLAA